MFAYLILLAVFLSFLAIAEDASFTMSAWDSQTGLYTIGAWARHLYNGFIPRHDVLNTIKCYCQDEDDISDPRYGYYYLFSYWNSQHKRSYSASWNCSTAGPDSFNSSDVNIKPAQCVDWVYKSLPSCSTSTDGNAFCFQLDDPKPYVASGHHYLSKANSSFEFNNSWQKLLQTSSDYMCPMQSQTNCAKNCKEESGMETVEDPPSPLLALTFGLGIDAKLYNGGQSFENLIDVTAVPEGGSDSTSIGSLLTLPFSAAIVLAMALALCMMWIWT